MIKYYKTPDVVVFEPEDQQLHCKNGLAIVDTDLLTDEENKTMMRLINRLGMVKCSKMESEERLVPTPSGIISFNPILIMDCPTRIEEKFTGVFDIVNLTNFSIDVNAEPNELMNQLYGE